MALVLTSDAAGRMLMREERLSREDVSSLTRTLRLEETLRCKYGDFKTQKAACSRRPDLRLDTTVDDAVLRGPQLGRLESFWLNDLSKGGIGLERPRRSIDTRQVIPEYLFGGRLRRVVLCSYRPPRDQVAFFREWVLHFDIDGNIPLLVLGDDKKTNVSEDRWTLEKNAALLYPKLRDQGTGYCGCVHAKLIIAEYPDGVRLCISSANLNRTHMLLTFDTWIVHDFPRQQQNYNQRFSLELCGFLAKMCRGYEDRRCSDGDTVAEWITVLLDCDCSQAKDVVLIQSCPGTHYFYEDDVALEQGSKDSLGVIRIVLDDVPEISDLPRGHEKARKADYLEDGIALKTGKIPLRPDLAANVKLLRPWLTVEIPRIYRTFSKKRHVDCIVATLRLLLRRTDEMLTLPERRIALTKLLQEIIVPQGYHGIRIGLAKVDWFQAYARGEEVLYYGYSPSIVNHRAETLLMNLAWASHVSPTVIGAHYKYADRRDRGWNWQRHPALLGTDDHFNKNTLAALKDAVYHPKAPPGEEASRTAARPLGRHRRRRDDDDQAIGSHAKWLYRVFEKPDGQTYGWCYVGSHNISTAAFGAGDKFGHILICNWELGVLFIEKPNAEGSSVPFHRRFPFPYYPGAPASKLRTKLTRADHTAALKAALRNRIDVPLDDDLIDAFALVDVPETSDKKKHHRREKRGGPPRQGSSKRRRRDDHRSKSIRRHRLPDPPPPHDNQHRPNSIRRHRPPDPPPHDDDLDAVAVRLAMTNSLRDCRHNNNDDDQVQIDLAIRISLYTQ